MNWLDVISPSKHPCDQLALERLEKKLKRRLPADYREFLISTNGGTLIGDRDLKAMLNGEREDIAKVHFYPLSGYGVAEIHEDWRINDIGSDAAIPIAHDGGTGFFFLLLDERHLGQIYFAYKDDFFSTRPDEWTSQPDQLPECMGFVAKDFHRLGGMLARKHA